MQIKEEVSCLRKNRTCLDSFVSPETENAEQYSEKEEI